VTGAFVRNIIRATPGFEADGIFVCSGRLICFDINTTKRLCTQQILEHLPQPHAYRVIVTTGTRRVRVMRSLMVCRLQCSYHGIRGILNSSADPDARDRARCPEAVKSWL